MHLGEYHETIKTKYQTWHTQAGFKTPRSKRSQSHRTPALGTDSRLLMARGWGGETSSHWV